MLADAVATENVCMSNVFDASLFFHYPLNIKMLKPLWFHKQIACFQRGF